MRPMWRRRWSPIRAWTFRDGLVEHYELREGRELRERHRFGPAGRPLTSATFEEGLPQRVVVHSPSEPVSFDTSEWSEQVLGPIHLFAPLPPSVPEEDVLVAGGEDWQLRVTFVKGPADPYSDAYRDGLVERCGCVLVDRTSDWIDGVAGARYRFELPYPSRPQVGEVWAVPRRDGVLVASYVADAPEGSDALVQLARGRAMMALVTWEDR